MINDPIQLFCNLLYLEILPFLLLFLLQILIFDILLQENMR